MIENKDKSGGNVKKGLIIGFIIILLAANAVLVFQNVNKSNTIASQAETIENQEADITSMIAQMDSIQFELTSKRNEILKLNGKVDELDQMIAQLKDDKIQLIREKDYAVANLQKYKDKVEGLTVQLKESDKRIANLTSQRDSLYKYNRDLTAKIEERNDSIRNLTLTTTQLAQTVAVAAALKAENIKIDAISDKGRLKEGPELRQRYIHKLMISFNLPKNNVATVEGKDIYLRIVEPGGAVLFDETMEGGIFSHEGKEIPYTVMRNVLYENNNQQVNFSYMKGSLFKLGKYTAELYADGFKIGESKFEVK